MKPSIITACFGNLETWVNAENQWRSGDTSKYVVSSLHRNIRRSTVFNVFQDNPCIHNILCAYPSNSCGLIGLPYKLLLTPKEKYFCLISRKFYFLICFNVTSVGHKLQLRRMDAAITVLFNNTYDGTEIVLIFMGSDNVAH